MGPGLATDEGLGGSRTKAFGQDAPLTSRRFIEGGLGVQYLAQGYLDSALKVFLHLSLLPEHHVWGWDQEPSASQPSPPHRLSYHHQLLIIAMLYRI